MKSIIIASLVLSTALLAGMGRDMPTFTEYDTDGNGKITQTEFENSQQQRMQKKAEEGRMLRNAGNAPTFQDVDVDGNGYLDANEFKAHQQSCQKRQQPPVKN